MTRIAIFASGSGSNAQNIAEYFKEDSEISIPLILANKADAYVLERAKNLNIDSIIFSNKELQSTDVVIDKLKEYDINFIVLAGFLLRIPENITAAFPNKIINIHPALLPKYGGKGMYGMNVHNAVVENKEKESGITIHFVNENYDEGQIIFQSKIAVYTNDTAQDVADKIHTLEYNNFPRVIGEAISSLR
ncbi:MAG: phosphoribosylglycinamide formyltransferase [Flavobacteriales bacterium]|nr:phosphoribosylglycinamide formyltransferase [Flavobacteriales bacterium]